MDLSENGQLRRLCTSVGKVVGTSISGESGEVEARAFHIERSGKPHVVVAGSTSSTLIVGMLVEAEGAASGMAAARVLVNERSDALRSGHIVTLPAGATGSRSVRGSTGAFAVIPAAEAGLPQAIDLLLVHAFPPLCEWEKASIDEVRSEVPDLVSRFKPPKPRLGTASAPRKPTPTSKTVVR
ncbi:MAG: hypothetical protein ACO3JL_21635, partial [Myxococcota bacterium]